MAEQAIPDLLISILQGSEAHWPFVRKTWLLSYASSEFARSIPRGVFHTFHAMLADRILRRGELRIATPAEDDNVYLGYSVLEPGVLHYVYVKPQFRSLGIARRLMEGLPEQFRYTHMTADGKEIAKKLGCIYNPYLVG